MEPLFVPPVTNDSDQAQCMRARRPRSLWQSNLMGERSNGDRHVGLRDSSPPQPSHPLPSFGAPAQPIAHDADHERHEQNKPKTDVKRHVHIMLPLP